MKQLSPKILLAYLFILPAIYSMFMLIIYKATGNSSFLALTPLKSLFPAILVLLLLPSIAFMMNTNYQSYTRLKGQRMLGLLIVTVWLFNVVLLIGACTSS